MAGTCNSPDPIFVAIEHHKELERLYAKYTNITDEVAAKIEGRKITRADRDAFDRINDASEKATAALTSTIPKTIEGIRAVLQYLLEDDSLRDDYPNFIETLLASPVLAVEARNVLDAASVEQNHGICIRLHSDDAETETSEDEDRIPTFFTFDRDALNKSLREMTMDELCSLSEGLRTISEVISGLNAEPRFESQRPGLVIDDLCDSVDDCRYAVIGVVKDAKPTTKDEIQARGLALVRLDVDAGASLSDIAALATEADLVPCDEAKAAA